MIGSKVTATLLIGWILSIGGVAWGRVCAGSRRNRFVLILSNCQFSSVINLDLALIFSELVSRSIQSISCNVRLSVVCLLLVALV